MAVVRVIPWKVRFMLLCFFVLTAYSSAAHSPGQVPSSMSSNSTNTLDTFRRLPRDVLPSHYRITIKLNLTELTFQGDEIIDLEVQNETQEIVLNAMKLRFLNVSLCSGTSCSRESDFRTIPESAIHIDDSNQKVLFRLGQTTLAPGPAKLKILYTGKLENNLVGLYYANQR
ncbi:unnamed protein product [Cyprideis torosa]|uniref:Uncharacterized protein n=1 Tax=Cyprideis torosa TaxID=163714 RepID=A0A7R8ZV09_9CRUS|nr:unnamed protein product [Cyprideis torosa]CAG0910267.1 unnamed protein product [Cyprideis torosa]